jgi:23S rRNA G2069 N7-methylase RlmK/C1962 C5-methylase RlmI
MPFKNGTFKLVVFDPPHLVKAGAKSWLALKYGVLKKDWQSDLKQGFAECFRVLAIDGVLIFKWAETQIKTSQVLQCTDQAPLFGHKFGKRSGTHWIVFMKQAPT